MFSRLDRYIMGQVASVTVFATVVLCLAVMLIQSVRLVDLIVNRGLPITEFAYIASLMIPRFVALIMPIALFGALLFTYNRMINESEMIVMRSAGLSSAGLARPALVVAVCASIVCLGMTLYMMPTAAQEMRVHVEKNRSQWGAALLHEGRFTNVGDTVTLFVKERVGSELFGLFYHNRDDPQAPYTIMAERGTVVETDDGPRILVLNGSRQVFQDGQLHHIDFDRTTIDIALSQEQSVRIWVQPEERFLEQLFNPDMTDAGDRHYHDNLIAEGHDRLVTPLLPLAYTAIALAFMLRSGFSRRGNVMAVVGAVAGMTIILIGHMSLSSAAAKDLRLLPLFYANSLLPAAIGLVLAMRSPKTKPRKRGASDSTPNGSAKGAGNDPSFEPAE